jgi:D-alanine-D-alanine ligase
MASVKKLRVALLFGGRSSEHSISCATAAGVMGAIDSSKYELIAVGITRDGKFVPALVDPAHWELRKGKLAEVVDEGASIEFSLDGTRRLRRIESNGATTELGAIDVVFPVLHGPYGEDGTIQGFLELGNYPYVGNGILASAAAMDKEFTKALLKAAGVPVTEHTVVRKDAWLDDPESVLEAVRRLGAGPWFVKPARAGSSVGVSKVKGLTDFAAAAETALAEDTKFVVEQAVVGRELECAVLTDPSGSGASVSVAGEIVVHGREFYDFEAKYQDEDSVDLIIPAQLDADQLAQMQRLAARAFEAIGGFGLARVDFFGTASGFIVNEINTMPGFTPLSMYPKLWQASGVQYADLIDRLIALALVRP